MENKVTYSTVKSTTPGHHKVIITYVENGKNKQDVIVVEEKNKLSHAEIIELAQNEFKKKHQPKPKKTFKGFIKKHKIIAVVTSVILVGGLITGIALGVASIKPNNKVPDDFDKMREAYKNYLIKTSSLANYGDLSADEIMNKIVIGTDSKTKEKIYSPLEKKTISNVETYYIKNINYEDGFNRDSWPASTHVSQALNLAITAEVKHDPKIKDIAIKMTYYWVFNNYRNTNWWQNELGADNNLASLGLFVFNDLNPKGQEALRGKVAEASFYYRPSLKTHTGANLFDYADITLKSSILSKNETEFNDAITRVESEITDQNLEGFQTDGSFFQHGQQVQIGSYGKGVIRLGKVLRTMAESSRVFDASKMEIVEKYILRGLRSMTHKGYTNYSAVSREIARENNLDARSSFKDFNVYLELDSFSKKDELQKYLDDLTDHKSTFDGMVYFDKAKMVAVNVDDLYMSFKGTAPYLTNTECVNAENKLGLNMSYGTNTCVMDTGREYYNIFPVWDYTYIPGTTSINYNTTPATGFPTPADDPATLDEKLLEIRGENYYNDQLYEQQLPVPDSTNDYVYGSTESLARAASEGVAVLMQRSNHHKENDFTVTCVATPEGMVLLGADLKYDGSVTTGEGKIWSTNDRKFHTTLDQINMPDTEPTLEDGDKKLTVGNAVYTILDNEHTIKTRVRTISNDWNRNQSPKDNPTEVKDINTFTAYIDHDDVASAKYAYSIQSKKKVSEGKTFSVVKNFDNNQKVQEVRLPDIDEVGKTVHRVVVIAYEDITNYQPSIGDPIEQLAKGEYKVVRVVEE